MEDIFNEAGDSVAGNEKKGKEKSIHDTIYKNCTVKNWDDLKRALKNEHAQRMHQTLVGLNGRNFVDTYMKLIEFVEPKVIRKDNKKMDDVDRRIEISIKRGKSA